MKRISRRDFLRTSAAGALSAAALGGTLSASACFETEAPNCTQTAVIEGYDFGPGAKATIIKLNQLVKPESVCAQVFEDVAETKESVDPSDFFAPHIVTTVQRPVLDAYTCDRNGERVDKPSRYLRIEMYCEPDSGGAGGVFTYDFVKGQTMWCKPYELGITLKNGAALIGVLGQKITAIHVDPVIDYAKASIPQLEKFVLDGQYIGTDGVSLTYAYYAPKGEKLPLVVWLHGGGEGGTDPSVPLLANKATALASDEFQRAMGGAAYVLVPQNETLWQDYKEGAGLMSVYTQATKELIDRFIAEHPEIDTDRIYVGGCSSGGYMTLNMVLQYPDFFAAAFPICEVYKDSGITDAELESIKTLPMWFTYAENDTTVLPENYSIPTIARLKAMDANLHTSVFADVHDTTGKYKDAAGEPYQYQGHWSWTYFYNDQCVDDVTGENMWTWLGKQMRSARK